MIVRQGNLSDFFDVPFNVYPKESPYVSPFKADLKRFFSEKNPLISQFGELETFVAYNDAGKPVGRLTAHIHRKSNELYGWKRGYFGYFDCEDQIETARALLDAAAKWNRDRGMTELWGNFNLTAMQQMGVMTGGFDRDPYIDQLYSPPHIAALLEKLGFTSTFPVRTFEVDLKKFDPAVLRTDRAKALLADPRYRWETLRKKELKTQFEFARKLLNDGFGKNPMFVPITQEEFDFQAKDMALIIDEKITSYVYVDNEPAGVIVAIPDLNPVLREVGSKITLSLPFKLWKLKRNPKRCLLIYASVRQDQHANGLGIVMTEKVMANMKERGYTAMGITWISDDNYAPLSLAKKVGAVEYHRCHLYRKDIA
jgi:GNAT superfamily N-acetyltransferase